MDGQRGSIAQYAVCNLVGDIVTSDRTGGGLEMLCACLTLPLWLIR